MAPYAATSGDRFVENEAISFGAAVFTSVANWSTSGLKDISWRGQKYLWSKSREFLRFVAAPKKAGETFELATNIKHAATRRKFERNGWRLCCPLQMSVDYWLLSRLHPALQRRVHRSQGPVRPAEHRLVQRPERLLSGSRTASHHSGNWLHENSMAAKQVSYPFDPWGKSPRP